MPREDAMHMYQDPLPVESAVEVGVGPLDDTAVQAGQQTEGELHLARHALRGCLHGYDGP